MNTKKRRRYSLRNRMLSFNFIVTFSSLLLGGVVFVVSVFFIVGKYIKNDINFFLREINKNLTYRIEYLEEIIYEIRDVEELMDYMQEDEDKSNKLASFQDIFTKVVDINCDKNMGPGGKPVIEKVYLFDKSGEFIYTSYYAMLYSDVERSNNIAIQIRKRFLQDSKNNSKELFSYKGDNNREYLVYTLYDDNMDDIGEVIYELRLDTIDELMVDMNNYEDSLWGIYHNDKSIIYSPSIKDSESLKRMIVQYNYEPYTIKVNDVKYRVYYEEMSIGLYVISAVAENQVILLLSDSVKIYFLIILLIMIITTISFIVVLYYLTKPLKDVTLKLRGVKEGNFETKLPDYSSEEFHEISETFNEMTSYVNHLIKQVYEKQLSIKELEVKFLQMQMNPHFMFNVLNMISLKAKMNKDEEVFKMISSFSQLLQAKIYKKDEEMVKVSQELEYVEYYLLLQSYRFGDRLSYSIDVKEESLKECYIPKLCIQLIVENAVIHGIEPLIGNGEIKIKIYREKDLLFIDIIDNGIGFEEQGEINFPIEKKDSKKGHNQVGLNNVNNIIKLTYGNSYGITGYSISGDKTIVRICIPVVFNQ